MTKPEQGATPISCSNCYSDEGDRITTILCPLHKAAPALVAALREALPTCGFVVDRDNGTQCGEFAPWSGSFGFRFCEEHQEQRIQHGRIKRGEGWFHEDVARGIAALALTETEAGQ